MKNLLSVFIALFFLSISWAQKTYDKAYLQNQNKKIQADISRLNKILAETKKESKNSLVYVVALDDKINNREQYISNAKKEQRFIEDDIYLKQLEINKYKRELADLRKDYGEVLVTAYKNKTVQNKMMFVLSSKDFGQAFRRIKYLQLYSDYQDKKASEIKDKIAAIEELKTSREKDIQDQKRLLAKQESEITKLETERVEKNKAVQEFKKNEGKIVAQLREKQKQQQKLEAQIQLAIEEEIAIEREKERKRLAKLEEERKERERLARIEAEKAAEAKALAEKEAKRLADLKAAEDKAKGIETPKAEPLVVATPKPVIKETPKEVVIPKSEYEKLSTSFEANRGRLPSPIPGGVVVSHYGRHEHPLIPGLMVNNKGVDISGPANSIAKAVFKGKVSRVMKPDGNLLAIMIQHGEFYSVYTNIDDPYVKVGDMVSTGQDLGHVFVNENNRSMTKFMIYNGKNIDNPESWIRLY